MTYVLVFCFGGIVGIVLSVGVFLWWEGQRFSAQVWVPPLDDRPWCERCRGWHARGMHEQ